MSWRWLWPVVLACATLATQQVDGAPVFPVEDCGAVADGRTDDGPAIRRAIAGAMAAGPGARVVLQAKTYRLGERPDEDFQFVVDGGAGLTIDGGGATLVNAPQNGLFAVRRSRNVTIRGFSVDYDPLPFTQGTIRAVDPPGGTLDVAWDAGYAVPPAAGAAQTAGPLACEWGTVMDAVERHPRWGVKDFTFVKGCSPLGDDSRVSRIAVDEPDPRPLELLRPGDRFVLPLRFPRSEAGSHGIGANIVFEESADCLLEDVTFHGARSGMVCAIRRNTGLITVRRLAIAFRPGTDRLITSWKDGMHCKDNRVGPVIEACSFEGMLDDSINMGANTAMAVEALSPTEFRLTGGIYDSGDSVLVITPLGDARPFTTTVAAVRSDERGRIVTLADAVPGKVVPGRMRPHQDVGATHFYNMSRCNRGFVVRGCTFLPQRRHAMLVRAQDGLIEDNRIDGVGGAAVWLGNEIGSYYEGPFPTGVTVRRNRIQETRLTPIVVQSALRGGATPITGQIAIEGNDITVRNGTTGILIERARDVRVEGNVIRDEAGHPLDDAAIRTVESVDVSIRQGK